MASTARQEDTLIYPPQYVRSAIRAYRESSTNCAAMTVALALASARYARELSDAGERQADKIVAEKVATLARAPEMRSRLFDIARLAEHLDREGKSLADIRSQGNLFALVAARKLALAANGPNTDLDEMLEDARALPISKFRRKWNRARSSAAPAVNQTSARTITTGKVLAWIRQARHPEVVKVYRAAKTRMNGTP